MKKSARFTAALAIGVAAGLSLATPQVDAAGAAHTESASAHVVFVATDQAAGNHIVAYRRGADGSLTLKHKYSTGGKGGALDGAVVDNTASQGALTYDRVHHLLLAVNAGSNNVSVFAVDDSSLRLLQVVNSGGTFPVSVTIHGRSAVRSERASRRVHPGLCDR